MVLISLLTITTAAVAFASPIEREPQPPLLSSRQIDAQGLSLTQKVNITNIKNLVSQGQSRIIAANSARPTGPAPQVNSGAVTNSDVSYLASVAIGGKSWSLVVDTGSSNTWCGAQTSCQKTSTGRATNNTASVNYGSGSYSGMQYNDTVSFGGLTVSNQSVSAATKSSGFYGVDGILGFGPAGLTRGTVGNTSLVPTFMDNLMNQKSISTQVLGVYFKPLSGSSSAQTNGQLTFGGCDASKYSGSLKFFPKLTTGTPSLYWSLAISNFTYGSTLLSSGATGIIDTGTTLIYIPSAAYNKFLSTAVGTTDSSTGLATFPTMPSSNFTIGLGTANLTLTPSQYLVPLAQYDNFGLTSGKYYSWISNGGNSGINTLIGQKFLENYYSVYDGTNSRIGFAPAL